MSGAPSKNEVGTITFLTEAQKDLLKNSFALFGDSEALKLHGVQLMINLFKSAPEVQDKFAVFKGMTAKELETSSVMRAHGTSIMLQFKICVDNFHDFDCLIALMKKNATNHIGRGVGFEDFEKLRQMFGSFLKQQLGDNATPKVVSAWDALLTRLSNAFV